MASQSQPTILAVDDSPLMQDLIKFTLGKEYRVLTASSAIDALATLNYETVSILLLDVSMPGIDGLDLCRAIRAMPQFSTLPIIMVTGQDTVMDKVKGRLAGATEYLTKPFDPGQLSQLVGRLAGASLLETVSQFTETHLDKKLINSES